MGNDQLYNVIVTAHAFVIIFFTGIAILIRGEEFWELPHTAKIGGPCHGSSLAKQDKLLIFITLFLEEGRWGGACRLVGS